MTKIEEIIKLIEDKSSILMEEYYTISQEEDDSEDHDLLVLQSSILGAVGVLDELHKDIKIIQSTDD